LKIWPILFLLVALGCRNAESPQKKSLVLTPSALDLPDGLSQAEWENTLAVAAQRWNVPCSPFVVSVAKPAPRWKVGNDGTNLIVFRKDVWCNNKTCGHTTTYPLRAMGMTSVVSEPAQDLSEGEADVEINAVAFSFNVDGKTANQENATQIARVSLLAVVMHEIGHVLGLKDFCSRGHTIVGNPIIDPCSNAKRQSVMFGGALAEQVSPEDIAVLCSLRE
jgi:hypothetical protein